MARLYFDTETDGFVENLTVIHCLVIKDVDTDQVWRFRQHIDPVDYNVADGVKMLEKADVIIGHNCIKFDVPAILKMYPWFKPRGRILDTLVLSRLMWPEIKDHDLTNNKARKKAGKEPYIPPRLAGKYSLEAWGQRMGVLKGDYSAECKAAGIDPWAAWSMAMEDYCEQDVHAGVALFRRCEARKFSDESIELEHRVAAILALQEKAGFTFNETKAGALYATLLGKRMELEGKLKKTFGSWEVHKHETFVPKRTNVKKGWMAGIPIERVKTKLIEFNPSSRDHIANRLTALYGWKPSVFTKSGKPQVDEVTMKDLKYPPIPLIMEYLLVDKRIAQIAEGSQAWLKACKKGRIHGAVNPNGAATRRMTHMFPNIAQVPKVGSAYGKECRELFEAAVGLILVGCDASGIELRCLAHFMAKWDGGAYANAVTQGKEADGTDVHSMNCKALGFEPQKLYVVSGKQQKGRDIAKTFIYAYLYGAGVAKLAKILGVSMALAASIMKRFLNGLPALKKLRQAIDRIRKERGFLNALDGAELPIRHAHAALNTLLQSAGALIMKRALVFLYDSLTSAGLVFGKEYAIVANVHDEWQIEVLPALAEFVGEEARKAIVAAGVSFKFRCPLDGAWKKGSNWAETH